jgi:hypothetical protein
MEILDSRREMIRRVAMDIQEKINNGYTFEPTDGAISQLEGLVGVFESYGAIFVIGDNKEKQRSIDLLREALDMQQLLQSVALVQTGNSAQLSSLVNGEAQISGAVTKLITLVVLAAKKECSIIHRDPDCTCDGCLGRSLLNTFSGNPTLSWLIDTAIKNPTLSALANAISKFASDLKG